MVANYKGVYHRENEQKQMDLLISDYMTTNLVTFKPEDSIYFAMHTLLKHRISGAPVVNEHGELVGILSEGDCLKEIVKGKYDNSLNYVGQVGDHMARDVITITPDMTILDAAQYFLYKRIRRFPVVKGNQLIGLLTQTDIMKAVSELNATTW